MQVKQYARQFGFQEDQKATLGSRLRSLEKLFKHNGLRTSEDLLEAAAQAQDALQRWDNLEGAFRYQLVDPSKTGTCDLTAKHWMEHGLLSF